MCSAVVLSWRRKFNLPRIIDNLLNQGFIRDIVVWHNCHENPLSNEDLGAARLDARVKVINATTNCYTLGRFHAIAHCKCEHIAVCDDDQYHRHWEALWELYASDPMKIHATLEPEHFKERDSHRFGPMHDMQIGFGSIFHKNSVDVFTEYLDCYPFDYLFRRKADRIFAMLQRNPHVPNDLPVSPMKGSDGRMSLHKRDDSRRLNIEVRKRCIAMRMQQDFALLRSTISAAQSYRILSAKYNWSLTDVKSACNNWLHNILSSEFGSWQTESTAST